MSWLLAVLLLGALISLVVLAHRKQVAQAELSAAKAEQERMRERLAKSEAEVESLAKYRGIVDAEASAHDLLSKARAEAEELRTKGMREAEGLAAQAQALKEQAASEAAAARSEAARRAAELQQQAEVVLAGASAEGRKLVEEAKRRAQEIAGEAWRAKEEAEHLEATAQAMRNVIEGYGDRYLLPTFGLLDELAEEFGFTEAGQCLKAARGRVRQLIEEGHAAACDYVEEVRRQTALEFVLDAFNGKVDTILGEVRHDNFGTLERKVRDAFELVNHLGQAFRNARIAPEYLQARLEELKWAVTAHELKRKDREEQRVIKERLREEERAQREFERALKEAAKEEETLRKAMEKARKDLEKAGDEQRARYEQQLAALSEKLEQAEKKNQRALSMAQQTKAGHVYVISNLGSFGEDVFKIGMTRRLEPLDRIRELGDASVPFEFDVHALIYSEDAPSLEHALHQSFVKQQMNKVNARKEFFRTGLTEIRQQVESLGCQASWTMAAECREYKETLALEKAMQEGRLEVEAWERQQATHHDDAEEVA